MHTLLGKIQIIETNGWEQSLHLCYDPQEMVPEILFPFHKSYNQELTVVISFTASESSSDT